ncbi:glycosyltransferase family 2 protein [Cycloclasticus sp. P1]|uniref:glycosyltransferase family 2 protein n=1 Tax=Cycloclasticus sp. (strain P1) TaxID=385025 RepID=UPI000286ABEF|nr:glycosyltransferase family 2 protein [Cycloclasticus sp. P1]AFT68014.1 Glycosyl transferase, group 2 family [Cycloclasticus sp. P1]
MCKVKVSVVIPVHNTEEYLEQCLDSVLSQTLEDIEVIVVNDCSPDGSAEIIDRYVQKDSRIVNVKHDVNKGLPEARNSGVLVAQGQYLVHLDSDDYWCDKTALQTLYRVAEVDECEILRFNGLHYSNGKHYQLLIAPENVVNGTFQNHEFWNYRSIFLYFFKKSFLDKWGLQFMPGLTLGEDAIFISSALPLANRISSIPNAFYAYRVDNLSLMRKHWGFINFKQEQEASRIVSNNIENNQEAHRKYWSFRLNHYWSKKLMARAFNDLSVKERMEYMKFVSDVVGDLDGEDLLNNASLSPVGKKVLRLLLAKDLGSLEEYLSRFATKQGADSSLSSIRKRLGYLKWRGKSLSKKGYKKFKRLSGKVTGKIGLRRRLARYRLQDKIFENDEGLSSFNFTLTKKAKPRGVSAMLRVKNEEVNIVSCLESIVECFDEVVVIDNGSTDGTATLVENFQIGHPLGQRVSLHEYPFEVAKCGKEHQETKESSLSSLAYYYNWCVSRCQYNTVCKWDADMLLSSSMTQREIFKRYTLRLAHSRRLLTGSLPVQTVYSDKEGHKFIAENEINQEIRFFPNCPAVFFVKAWDWEKLHMEFPIHNKALRAQVAYELKDVKQDEFSHWSTGTFTGERKVKEYRNFMYIKKLMHLDDQEGFIKMNAL